VRWILAQSLQQEGQYEAAEAELTFVLPQIEERLGPGCPLAMHCRGSLALALGSQQYVKAQEVLDEGCRVCTMTVGALRHRIIEQLQEVQHGILLAQRCLMNTFVCI
jgi:hypothetical protein